MHRALLLKTFGPFRSCRFELLLRRDPILESKQLVLTEVEQVWTGSFRELVPLAKRINRLTFDKDIGALFAQQKLDEQLLRIGVRHPLQDGGPSRELPKDSYRNGILATGMNEQKSSGLRHRR